jgi:hypothetical protein
MPAITMRLLGATVPARPSAEDGMKYGNATALAAIVPWVKNRRRLSDWIGFVFISSFYQSLHVVHLSLVRSILPAAGSQYVETMDTRNSFILIVVGQSQRTRHAVMISRDSECVSANGRPPVASTARA